MSEANSRNRLKGLSGQTLVQESGNIRTPGTAEPSDLRDGAEPRHEGVLATGLRPVARIHGSAVTLFKGSTETSALVY